MNDQKHVLPFKTKMTSRNHLFQWLVAMKVGLPDFVNDNSGRQQIAIKYKSYKEGAGERVLGI